MFKERVRLLTVCCLIIALFGSVFIAWRDISVSSEALFGDVLSLIGTIFVSAYLLTGQKVSNKVDANAYSIIVFFIGGTVMLIYIMINRYSLIEYNLSDWTYFLLLAIIPSIFVTKIKQQHFKQGKYPLSLEMLLNLI